MPPNMTLPVQAVVTGANSNVSGSETDPLSPNLPGGQYDPDKRMRREIANSNERRRMQSINSGFQGLRALLPKREGDKISKVGRMLFWLQ